LENRSPEKRERLVTGFSKINPSAALEWDRMRKPAQEGRRKKLGESKEPSPKKSDREKYILR